MKKKNRGKKNREAMPKAKRKINKLALAYLVLAVLCFCYFLAIRFVIGFGSNFYFIWFAAALFFGGCAMCVWFHLWKRLVPKWLRIAIVSAIAIGASLFLITEGIIFSGFFQKGVQNADYAIVLGAQWKWNGPSLVLKKRLDAANIYLQNNPNTKVIVSGGQGFNEPISEAEGMKQYLINAGIEEDRIITEALSTSTSENLKYSSSLLDIEQSQVVIITSDFHVFRGCAIARKCGYKKVTGLAAPSVYTMLPNNLLREFMGVWKDWLTGNM